MTAGEREVGSGFNIETGVFEEKIFECFDDSVVVCKGEIHLLNPSEVCFLGSFLSGCKRKGLTGIIGYCQATCLTKGVLVGMYRD